jgi:hypothetical protein
MRLAAVQPRLWGIRAALVVVAGNAVALLLIAAGWLAVSGARSLPDQQNSINVGLAGVMVAGAANAVWLGAGRRSVRSLRDAVLPGPEAVGKVLGRETPGTIAAVPPGELVTGPGMIRYHRPGCAMARGKALTSDPQIDHERAGLVPCEVCRP